MSEEREQLFFAGDHPVQFVQAGLRRRIGDLIKEPRVAADGENRALGHHVGDEQRGKVIALPRAEGFQSGQNLLFAAPKLREAELLDLGDAEGPASFDILFAIGGNGLVRGLGD